jgi:hypothetical protein
MQLIFADQKANRRWPKTLVDLAVEEARLAAISDDSNLQAIIYRFWPM